MALFLITESKEFDCHSVETIIESVTDETGQKQKNYYINGVFIQCNVKNRNGRNYSDKLMKPVVDKYKRERMDQNFGFRSFGELGHPEGVEINLDKVCHYTKSLEWHGNDCIGKAELLIANPSGRILQTFLDKKLRVGVSTRGLGALAEEANRDGSKEVTAYEMIAVDAVADPSAPKGFVDGILENKQYIVQDNGIILECYDNLQKSVSILPRKSDARAKLFIESVETFLSDLRKL